MHVSCFADVMYPIHSYVLDTSPVFSLLLHPRRLDASFRCGYWTCIQTNCKLVVLECFLFKTQKVIKIRDIIGCWKFSACMFGIFERKKQTRFAVLVNKFRWIPEVTDVSGLGWFWLWVKTKSSRLSWKLENEREKKIHSQNFPFSSAKFSLKISWHSFIAKARSIS